MEKLFEIIENHQINQLQPKNKISIRIINNINKILQKINLISIHTQN
jgi:hypothetical protein